jgi:hypothetical protein
MSSIALATLKRSNGNGGPPASVKRDIEEHITRKILRRLHGQRGRSAKIHRGTVQKAVHEYVDEVFKRFATNSSEHKP